MEHRAADDAAARDHRLAEAAILREATVASMVASMVAKQDRPKVPTAQRRRRSGGDGAAEEREEKWMEVGVAKSFEDAPS